MCLLICKPKGKGIPQDYLMDASIQNSDGFGVVWKEKSKTYIERGLDMNELLLINEQLHPYSAMIHLRLATHGKVSIENCHPFEMLGGQFYLAHNGVIDIERPRPDLSDSWHFAKLVVEPWLQKYPSLFGSRSLERILGPWLSHSKIALFDSQTGAMQVLNKDLGTEMKGIWYSNVEFLWKPEIKEGHYWWDEDEESNLKPTPCTYCYQDLTDPGAYIDNQPLCQSCLEWLSLEKENNI